MGSQFLKEHSPVLTEVFGANSNLQVGNPAHLFYNTLHASKNSQDDDQSKYYNVIATFIIRRIVRLHQEASKKSTRWFTGPGRLSGFFLA